MIAGEWQDHLMFAKLADEHVPTYLTEAAATKRSGGHREKLAVCGTAAHLRRLNSPDPITRGVYMLSREAGQAGPTALAQDPPTRTACASVASLP